MLLSEQNSILTVHQGHSTYCKWIMKQFKLISSTLLGFVLLMGTQVKADEDAVRASIKKAMPSLKIDSVIASEAKGIFEVTAGANIIYVSEDGKYLLQGHLIDIAAKKDLTEAKLAGARKQALADMGEDNMIIFKPKDNKYKVSVFTDIDCGYCRKLHSELDQYMDKGITIQYLFYPRAGKGSESYYKAISVWCAEDRNSALTVSKSGGTLEQKKCENPVDKHMELAQKFEVRGTPMIVTENGTVLPGYVPADRLVKVLIDEKL